MKTFIAVTGLLVALATNASTWTIHGTKDNATFVGWRYDIPLGTQTSFIWDYAGDSIWGPSSGILLDDWTSGTDEISWLQQGYSDVLTWDLQDDWAWMIVDISGPAPDYQNFQGNFSVQPGEILPGEYWLDFDLNGKMRLSTTQPTDFGKWAWDGSVNPSWVSAKKGFAKGHNKQPLLTTK